MVVVDGIRYTVEDAERLGLITKPPEPKQAARPANKQATPKNK